MSQPRRVLLGAAAIAVIQVAVAAVAIVVWQRTAGGWSEVAFAGYAIVVLVVLPIVGFAVGRHVAQKQAVPIWWAWPVAAGNLLAFGAAHGLEDAGVGVAGILVGLASVSFLTGWAGLTEIDRS